MTPTRLERESFYADFRRRGLDFGARFRGVKQVWSHPGKALGLIEAPLALGGEPKEYGLHPALLDACLQVVAGALTQSEMKTRLKQRCLCHWGWNPSGFSRPRVENYGAWRLGR